MKITTKLTLCDDPTIESLEQAISTTLTSETKSLLIFACGADKWLPEELDILLKDLKIPILGGVFPYIIFDSHKYDTGTLIVGLNIVADIFLIENLSQGKEHIEAQLDQFSCSITKEKYLMSIVDGLTPNIQRFTEYLYEITGHKSVTFGGGAGTLGFMQQPCLFTNKGMIFDAAIIAAIPTLFTLGVSHGWNIIAGPFLVTKSKGNILESLDYFPAFDVYQKHLLENTGHVFDQDDFYNEFKEYPLGIENLEGEILARVPMFEDNKSLIISGEIPENSIIYLLKGTHRNLISASGKSAKMAYEMNQSTCINDMSVILFDCVSRSLVLGNDFCEELDVIKENLNSHPHIFGALSIGEIGSNKNGPIEWLNTSTAIAVF